MKDILGWSCVEGCTCIQEGHVHYDGSIHESLINKQQNMKKQTLLVLESNSGSALVFKRNYIRGYEIIDNMINLFVGNNGMCWTCANTSDNIKKLDEELLIDYSIKKQIMANMATVNIEYLVIPTTAEDGVLKWCIGVKLGDREPAILCHQGITLVFNTKEEAQKHIDQEI